MRDARGRTRLRCLSRGTLGAANDRVWEASADGNAGKLKRAKQKVDVPIAAVAVGARTGNGVGEEGAFAGFADAWNIPSIAIQIAIADTLLPTLREAVNEIAGD